MAPTSAIPCKTLTLAAALPLDSGRTLDGVIIAYETYGELAADRSNAILIFHALTGEQFVASTNPITGKPGWWERMVGPGLPIDTDRYHIICANIIGGCSGSTGPTSPVAGGAAYGMSKAALHQLTRNLPVGMKRFRNDGNSIL